MCVPVNEDSLHLFKISPLSRRTTMGGPSSQDPCSFCQKIAFFSEKKKTFCALSYKILTPRSKSSVVIYKFCHIFHVGKSTLAIVHSLSSGKVEIFLCTACHAFTPHVKCVEALNRYCGSSLSQGVFHVQALNGNSAQP